MENINKPLVNKVAQSKLVTINMEDFFPAEEILVFDIKSYLFQGLLLKEMDFRKSMKDHDWSQYKDAIMLIQCSSDAIIPVWAYSLIAKYSTAFVKELFVGSKEEFIHQYYKTYIQLMDVSEFTDKMIVIKGCSEKAVPAAAYAYLCQKLVPVAKSIMYGEPCSTVPIHKKPRV